jgi:hypothetical protein
MSPNYVPALAALAGSAIGGLTSFASTWLNQARQDRASRLSQDKARQPKLYADALMHDEAEVSALVSVYSLIGQMRVLSRPLIIEGAEAVVRTIVDTYFSPNKTFLELRKLIGSPAMDPLRAFSEKCREDLSNPQPPFTARLAKRAVK